MRNKKPRKFLGERKKRKERNTDEFLSFLLKNVSE